jgi:hypothetical protein
MLGTLILIALIPVAYIAGKKGFTIDTNQFKNLNLKDLLTKLASLVDSWIKKFIKKS